MIRISNTWPYSEIWWFIFLDLYLTITDSLPFFARFLIGFFFGGIPWYIGTLILLCVRVDYREKPGYIACTIAVSIFVLQYLFFLLHEVVFYLCYFLSLWFHILIWTSANNFASVHYISFETGPNVLKWAIYLFSELVISAMAQQSAGDRVVAGSGS